MGRFDYEEFKGYCKQARKDLGLDAECCTSCHEEFMGGWQTPLEIHLENGDYYLVCCSVADEYHDE